PPENALLRGRLTQERQQERGHPRQPVRAVAEVAVEARRDGEHPQVVGADAQRHAEPREADEEDAEGKQVNDQESGDGGRPESAVRGGVWRIHPRTLTEKVTVLALPAPS